MMRSDFFVGQPMFYGWRAEEPPPSAPVITSTLARNAQVGASFSYTIIASGRPTPTFTATNLPPGLTLSGRVISGKPTTAVPAPGHSIDLTATNTEGSDTKTLVVIIAEAGTGGGGTGPTPTPPWEVTFEFSDNIVNVNGLNIGGVLFPPNGRIPLVEWVGWQASYGVDMSNDLYNVATQAQMPVRLYATFAPYATTPEVEIPFDNWGPHPAVGGSEVIEWGYAAATNSVTVKGTNATGNPIRLRLDKA